MYVQGQILNQWAGTYITGMFPFQYNTYYKLDVHFVMEASAGNYVHRPAVPTDLHP
jgi:hypothetical protein